MPKISTRGWTAHPGAPHPVTGESDGPYDEIVLGDAAGLSQCGVRLERLPPGSRSSHRHWHEAEDEFVYVVSGELVLVEEGEVTLSAGEAAGWAHGRPVGHCLENRSGADAIVPVFGMHYPDHGMVLHRRGNERRYTGADGRSQEDGGFRRERKP